MTRLTVPTEAAEARALVKWLDAVGLTYLHIPNERKTSPRRGLDLKRQGVKGGAPDYFILNRPPSGACGVALELKREKGGRVTRAQLAWLGSLERFGWEVLVAHGAVDAVEKLSDVYGLRGPQRVIRGGKP